MSDAPERGTFAPVEPGALVWKLDTSNGLEWRASSEHLAFVLVAGHHNWTLLIEGPNLFFARSFGQSVEAHDFAQRAADCGTLAQLLYSLGFNVCPSCGRLQGGKLRPEFVDPCHACKEKGN